MALLGPEHAPIRNCAIVQKVSRKVSAIIWHTLYPLVIVEENHIIVCLLPIPKIATLYWLAGVPLKISLLRWVNLVSSRIKMMVIKLCSQSKCCFRFNCRCIEFYALLSLSLTVLVGVMDASVPSLQLSRQCFLCLWVCRYWILCLVNASVIDAMISPMTDCMIASGLTLELLIL